jgi:GMP synthase (glutamine-hydrolysing)
VTKVLVCQHVAFEILGTLNPLLKRAGVRIRYVNFGRHPDAQPSVDGYDGLIILGGPMSVYDVTRHPHLDTEVRMVNDAMERGIPVLGICLGAQLIARALGARVEPNSEKEIGWYDVRFSGAGRQDPLFAHCGDSERIFQWHGDAFELPRGAVHLASTPVCTNQAFRYGTNVYGFQFHLEVDEPLIGRWLRTPVHLREIESLNGKICPIRIQSETPANLARSQTVAEQTFSAFIALFAKHQRWVALPSR